MKKYQLTILLIVAAVIFTIIAALSMNRVVIATLFLALLAFIGVSEGALRRSRRGMAEMVEAGLVDSQRSEAELVAQGAITPSESASLSPRFKIAESVTSELNVGVQDT